MPDKKDMVVSEAEVTDLNETLGDFSKNIRKSIQDLKEDDGGEICLLKDESAGLWCELHSRRLSADKLLDLCANGFSFIKNQRQFKPVPTMIN